MYKIYPRKKKPLKVYHFVCVRTLYKSLHLSILCLFSWFSSDLELWLKSFIFTRILFNILCVHTTCFTTNKMKFTFIKQNFLQNCFWRCSNHAWLALTSLHAFFALLFSPSIQPTPLLHGIVSYVHHISVHILFHY